jgi:DNA-binding CsgD family transcriptional regulator
VDGATRALELAAAGDGLPVAVLEVALAAEGLALAALETAEDDRLLELRRGRIVMRDGAAEAILGALSGPRRRAAHRALAAALPEGDARRLLHLASASPGADDRLAVELERRATSADAGEAALFLERAAGVSAPAERARRFYLAAAAARRAGRAADAAALAGEALAEAGDAPLRARVRRLQLELADPIRSDLSAYEALVTEAAAVEADDSALAASLYADAALSASTSDVAAAAAAAARGLTLARSGGTSALPKALLASACAAVSGGDGEAAAAFLGEALRELDRDDAGDAAADLHQLAVVLLYLEEYEQARRLLERAAERARASGSFALLAVVLDTLAAIDSRTGRLGAARARSLEALRLARAAGHAQQAASCLTTLAAIDAIQGRERGCRTRAAEAAALVPEDDFVHVWAAVACAQLDLGLGRVDAVVAAAPHIDAVVGAIGSPASLELLWLPLEVECCTRVGRVDDARDALARLAAAAASLATPHAHAVTARCRAIVAGAPEAWGWFDEALGWHALSPRPFERARTELAYGERLRRARRRMAARERLESALASFERLHAAPWAERARRELGGAEPRGRRSDPAAALTAREREIAALVTGGATNREAAAALFVTPKTVEHHLTTIYAKLGIRSRTELTRTLLSTGG